MSADEHPAGTDPLELALAEAGYVPLLSRDGGVSATVIARQLRVRGERTVATEVWRRTFEDPQEASVHHAWLRGKANLLTEWGRIAAIMGPDALSAEIDAAWSREVEKHGRERESAEKELRDAETIWLEQADLGREGMPGIVMFTGAGRSEPFLTIRLDEKWEQERIFDWAQWRSDDYAAWMAHREEHGEESLERLMMTEMLRTENAVRKAGLGSGGRRPLRFWRGEGR